VDKHILDTIDPAVVGERLAEARRARHLTQQHVADELDVARTTSVAMEKGERRPRPGELLHLARLYGRQVSDFVRPRPSQVEGGFVVQFRAARGPTDIVPAAER
jgi:transcriptional regulator with XRE-family HTH domain